MGRNKQIDSLRGLSVILIVFYHLLFRYQQIYLDRAGLNYWMGVLGSYIFLIISSYFLVNSRKSDLGSGKNRIIHSVYLVVHKLVRLWPTYFVSITLTFLITRLLPLPGRTCTLIEYMLNIPFLNGFIGIPYVDASHWYLTTLISLTTVISAFKFCEINNNVFSYIIWAVCGGVLYKLDLIPILRIFGDVYIGVALVGISIRKWNDSKKWIVVTIVGLLYTVFTSGILNVFLLIVAAVIVLLCVSERMHFINQKLLVYIGGISYPLYLCHQNLGFIVEYYLNNNKTFSYTIGILSVIIVFCVAILFYYLVERPLQRYLKLHLKEKI